MGAGTRGSIKVVRHPPHFFVSDTFSHVLYPLLSSGNTKKVRAMAPLPFVEIGASTVLAPLYAPFVAQPRYAYAESMW